ncbi:uncharacterized protein LOC114517391 [Dendronephthya gigantea]|uniref:uncharacterized protein LOC114517391 n=1 Tax=Dendronephthya gigantea TaxID=151771 RepID=UPI0010698AE8|nr:uncharacterized protein LOC114517391 [Dendronephthya gigantea]
MVDIKIVSTVLKFAQICPLVIGMGFMAHFTKEFHDFTTQLYASIDSSLDPYDNGSFGRYEFYLFSVGVGIGIAVLGLICALRGLMEKKYGALSMTALQALWAFHLLVATSLLAKSLSTYEKKAYEGGTMSLCKMWDQSEGYKDYDFNCSQIYGAVVCGFIAMALFAMDTVMSMVAFNRAQL